ncbi:Plasmodium exported protein, unknown function [Plasmodium vivax]|uniref:Variable surface protein n=1 Tax=Plasmodium vivax TaxID=5855 RepID=A0A1G4EAY7_PLAVI|nr:Plasmodium exported protein, unknown function [Plasmodium vivax]
MIVLNYYRLMENINFMSDKYLDKEYIVDRTLDIRFPRSLAKHIQEKELYNTNIRQNLLDHGKSTKIKNFEECKPTYSKIKMNDSSNIDIYMKDYKRRYAKKRGLSKLDCYCEKKVFDKINKLNEFRGKIHNDKNRYKKSFFRKYGVGLILFVFIPAVLGSLLPILLNGDEMKQLIPMCNITCKKHDPSSSNGHTNQHVNVSYLSPFTNDTWKTILNINDILSLSFVVIFLIIMIYIFIKFIKYEGIKAGNRKIPLKEYFRFHKYIF